MPKKPKHRSPTPEVFQVEVITGARVNSDGDWEYHVKWAGYSESDNSWEPHENVQECDRLLKSFWNHIGIDNEDYPLGYTVHAQKYWIINEKEFFAKELSQQLKQKRNDKQAEKKSKAGVLEKGKSKKKIRPLASGSARLSANAKGKAKQTTKSSVNLSDGSDDDQPLTIKINKRRLVISSDDSDSQDTQPLRKVPKTTFSLDTTKRTNSLSTSLVDVEDSPASHTSLFSDDSSSEKPQPSSAKTFSKPQPKIKVMGLEPHNVATGSALSTKQRIFQNATSGSNAKPKLPVVPKRSSLGNLGFKKTLPNPSRTTSSSKDAKPQHDPLFTDSNEITSSPTSYDPMHDVILPFEASQQSRPDLPSPEARLYSSPPPLPYEPLPLVDPDTVEEFLNQIAPPPPDPMDLPEPMPDPPSSDPVVPNSLMLPRPTVSSLPKIPKKWKWSGELFMNTTADHAEQLCAVNLSDSTDAPQNGQGFSIYFSTMDSIRFTKLINAGDLGAIMPACGSVLQLAKLRADGSRDEAAFSSLSSFMEKNRHIAVMPLFADNAEVASLVVFPSILQSICRRFKVPSDMQRKGALVAALFPWSMRPADYSKCDILSNSRRIFAPPEFKQRTSHAMQLLEFPQDLRAYMSQPGRTYCVWWSPGDGTTATPGLETNQLHAIMKSCKAKNVGHKADVRVVFVHVGALVTLYRFPALAERRSKRPEIHFYTYGTHTSVPRERWGVNAIYPLGGIVTFTPEALLEDSIGAARLIHQISEHPFWDCYLLPSVVGMAARRSCEGTEPLSAFKLGDFPLRDIVDLLAEREVSLLQAPPVHGHDPQLSWVSPQLKLLSLRASGLLEMCLSAFSTQYSNTPIAKLSSAVEAEVSKDLLRMQTQPSIMENYRRFVIITSSTGPADSNKDGFEWITLAKFDFKDKFFEKRGGT